MVDNGLSQNNSSKEIDLWSILKLCWRSLGSGLGSCLRFIYRNRWWIVLFIAAGAATGFLIGHFSKKYYQTIVLMQSKNVNCSLVIREIDALNSSFQRPNYKAIAKMLSVTEDEAKLIKSVTGIFAMDVNRDGYPDYADLSEYFKKNPSDTSLQRMSDFFYLKMELYSPQTPENIPIAIKNFIGSNEFCKKENVFHLEQKKARMAEFKYQLSLLDSLERTDYFINNNSSAKGEQIFMLGNRDRTLFHHDYLLLYEKMQNLELDLELYSNDVVTIMQDIPQPSLTPKNGTRSYMIFFTLLVLVLGIIVLIFKENWGCITRFFKES